jgi:hypothetical protein
MTFDAKPVLAQLKDFQRDTAEHVFTRMFTDEDPARRFLVADEVGLGKTLVARGVIAKAIEHLQNEVGVKRVDVIYVCSNTQIARQNLARLRVGEHEHFEVADRLTMLPATAHQLARNKVNIVSFTPGTSFDLKGGGGMARERAMLRLMLRKVWGADRFTSRGSMRVFQGGVQQLTTFEARYKAIEWDHGHRLDASLVKGFRQALSVDDHAASAAGQPTLKQRFAELCQLFGHDRPKSGWSAQEKQLRSRFVGDLRDLLARACLDALEPDLIILDEFQRFKHLLVAPDAVDRTPAAELAHELFTYADAKAGAARVLLLSATPYQMLTSAADEDDHHADLVATVDFLTHHDPEASATLRSDLRDLRRGVLQVGRDGGVAAMAARDRVQSDLRRVMVRTERLAATPDRGGMLVEHDCDALTLTADEVERFVAASRLARHLDVPDPLEYWKSAPFLLNYMEHYKMAEAVTGAIDAGDDALAGRVTASGVLDFDAVRRFDAVDPGNARLRWLTEDTVGRGAWQLLWIPPSLPYLEPSGAYADPALQRFTKRLVFSSWTMVPKAIATLLTYEAERRVVTVDGPARYTNTTDGRASRGRLLDFALTNDRLTGMPVFGVLYPSVVLTRLGDQIRLCDDAGGAAVPAAKAVAQVADEIRTRLAAIEADLVSQGRTLSTEGRADETWYWAAPLWLDWLDNEPNTDDFFASTSSVYHAFVDGDDGAGHDRFRDHIHAAREAAFDYPPQLGRMPDDLADVLARMALTAPGVVALRALVRVTGRPVDDLDTRFAACRVAWALRSLFNGPEATEVVRGQHPGDPYWQRILDYALAGNLQSLLDEYAHVLVSARGHVDVAAAGVVDDLADAMHNTINLRTVNYGVNDITIDGDRVRVDANARLRSNFALRLSDERADDGSQTRMSEVRDAFNSPFWPFVLTTTSAGQEGLDFHLFCHAIVHWNLPASPVDLEQREGRIHRFEGHAVRRYIAADYAEVGRRAGGDPWAAMFAAAHADRGDNNDIVPYWVYTGHANPVAIERYVPALPLSRDRTHAERLKRAVASYRLAFGQPRQDDLLAYLAEQVDAATLERLADDLRVDLTPPRRTRKATVSPA